MRGAGEKMEDAGHDANAGTRPTRRGGATSDRLTRFDAETFREALGIFIADFNKLPLPERGIEGTSEAIVAALANRLKVTAWLDARPELLTRPIERPVFR